jgi:hypothetical protein
MATIFLLVGSVLTAISYRPKEDGEHNQRFIDRQVSEDRLLISPLGTKF